jgi:DnaJ family protein C protein 17
LTLILQFPPTSTSSSTSTDLQDRLTSSYGPINHVFLKDPVAPAETGKKNSKGKGKKAIVEFKEGNWGGCWACWRDILAGQGEWEGVKVKFAAGETPEWVAWSETHRPQPQPQPQVEAEPRSTIPKDPPASQGKTGTALPTFSSAPNFGQSTMSDLLASHNQSRAQSRAEEAERKKRESEFESMTILKMRQMERERLAEEIRREEEGLV